MDILLNRFRHCLESEAGDRFLEILLDLMAIALRLPHLNQNIKGFNARYVFNAQDRSLGATAIFEHDTMKVKHEAITDPQPNITITFKNSKALMRLLLAHDPDILGAMLHQDVQLEGNLNYLYKFAYMARHLQLMTARAI